MRHTGAHSTFKAHHSYTLFVNRHPRDLLDPDLHDERAALTSIAGRVVLEITERSAITDVENARAMVIGLRKQGFRIAVVDPGGLHRAEQFCAA